MMYVPGQNAHEEMVSIVDHYKKRIAELEAECKENGTALNRILLTLRDAQAENRKLLELLHDVFENPNYLTDSYFKNERHKLKSRYKAACKRLEGER